MSVSSLPIADVTRFHLSLNVNSLAKSIRFLTTLLGSPPVKQRDDYAKFEPADLPLVLSLEPRSLPQTPLRSTAGEGALNHVGIRMTDASQLASVQQRLEAAGYTTQREDGVECCYARQTKFWVFDDDRTMWEVYVLDKDLEHRGSQAESSNIRIPVITTRPSVPDGSPAEPQSISPLRTWTHRLFNEFPASLPDAGTWDEVLLQGSWNARRHQQAWTDQLRVVMTGLRPGGKLILHLLTANEVISQLSPLPGPASVVEVVPPLNQIVTALETAGFQRLELLKYASSPCFTQNGIELRETRLQAFSPMTAEDPHASLPSTELRVLYKGPFAQIVDDCGVTFQRGKVRSISPAFWQHLMRGPWASSFALLSTSDGKRLSCGMPASTQLS